MEETVYIGHEFITPDGGVNFYYFVMKMSFWPFVPGRH